MAISKACLSKVSLAASICHLENGTKSHKTSYEDGIDLEFINNTKNKPVFCLFKETL